MNIELGTGVTKSEPGPTKASKALRVVGVMGKALAYVEVGLHDCCVGAALDGAFEEDYGPEVCCTIPLLWSTIDFT